MGLTWTSALQDHVALFVAQKQYSELRTFEKNVLDATSAVPTATPGGVAGYALTYVSQYAQWFTEAAEGTAQSPAQWEGLLVADAAYRFAIAIRREDVKLHADALARAWDAALDTYSNVDAYAGAVQDTSVHLRMLRFYVIRRLVRLRGRPKVPVSTIDMCARQAFERLWNHGVWTWRLRNVTITLPSATPAAPTMDLPAGEVFQKVISPALTFTSDAATRTCPTRCLWADSQEISDSLASVNIPDAKPEKFHFEIRGDGSRYWLWFPAPDQNYTLRAQVAIDTPTWPTTTTDTAPFSKLPPAFLAMYPEAVLAQVMRSAQIRGWQEVWDGVGDALDGFLERQQERGTPEAYGLSAQDVYQDTFGISTRM